MKNLFLILAIVTVPLFSLSYFEAMELKNQGKSVEVLNYLNQNAYKLKSDEDAALLSILTYQLTGDINAALRFFESIDSRDNKNPTLLASYAHFLILKKAYTEAEFVLRRARLISEGENPYVLYNEIFLYLVQERYEQSHALLVRAQSGRDWDSVLFLLDGSYWMHKTSYKRAREVLDFSAVQSKHPNALVLYHCLNSLIHQANNDSEKVIASISLANRYLGFKHPLLQKKLEYFSVKHQYEQKPRWLKPLNMSNEELVFLNDLQWEHQLNYLEKLIVYQKFSEAWFKLNQLQLGNNLDYRQNLKLLELKLYLESDYFPGAQTVIESLHIEQASHLYEDYLALNFQYKKILESKESLIRELPEELSGLSLASEWNFWVYHFLGIASFLGVENDQFENFQLGDKDIKAFLPAETNRTARKYPERWADEVLIFLGGEYLNREQRTFLGENLVLVQQYDIDETLVSDIPISTGEALGTDIRISPFHRHFLYEGRSLGISNTAENQYEIYYENDGLYQVEFYPSEQKFLVRSFNGKILEQHSMDQRANDEQSTLWLKLNAMGEITEKRRLIWYP